MRVLVSSPVVVLLFLDLRGFLVPLGAPRLYGTGFAHTEVEDCAPKLGASDGKTRAAEGAAIRIVASRHNFCSPPNTGRNGRTEDICNRGVYFMSRMKPHGTLEKYSVKRF